ncbi:hypothetical protein LguiB_004164 [Lonicera macranthoides]
MRTPKLSVFGPEKSQDGSVMALLNPATRKFRYVELFLLSADIWYYSSTILGFGFVPKSDDYKVVEFQAYEEMDRRYIEIWVMSEYGVEESLPFSVEVDALESWTNDDKVQMQRICTWDMREPYCSSWSWSYEIYELIERNRQGFAFHKPSSFETLSAFVWRARTKAWKLCPDQQIKLLMVDERSRLYPPLPEGYFGNGVVLVHHRLLGSNKSYSSLAATVFISSWSRLSFNITDFGGEYLLHMATSFSHKEAILFLAHGADSKSINVLVASLSLEKLPKLLKITHKGYTFNWPSLKKLTLVDCGKSTEISHDTLQVILEARRDSIDSAEASCDQET